MSFERDSSSSGALRDEDEEDIEAESEGCAECKAQREENRVLRANLVALKRLILQQPTCDESAATPPSSSSSFAATNGGSGGGELVIQLAAERAHVAQLEARIREDAAARGVAEEAARQCAMFRQRMEAELAHTRALELRLRRLQDANAKLTAVVTATTGVRDVAAYIAQLEAEVRADSAAASKRKSSKKRRRPSSSTTAAASDAPETTSAGGELFGQQQRKVANEAQAVVGANLDVVSAEELAGILLAGKGFCARDLALALCAEIAASAQPLLAHDSLELLLRVAKTQGSELGLLGRVMRIVELGVLLSSRDAELAALLPEMLAAHALEAASADLHSVSGSSEDRHSQGDIACTLAHALSSLCKMLCDSATPRATCFELLMLLRSGSCSGANSTPFRAVAALVAGWPALFVARRNDTVLCSALWVPRAMEAVLASHIAPLRNTSSPSASEAIPAAAETNSQLKADAALHAQLCEVCGWSADTSPAAVLQCLVNTEAEAALASEASLVSEEEASAQEQQWAMATLLMAATEGRGWLGQLSTAISLRGDGSSIKARCSRLVSAINEAIS